jgi:hypothetical protein
VCCFCFYLRSVSCVHCCLCLSIIHFFFDCPIGFLWRLFIVWVNTSEVDTTIFHTVDKDYDKAFISIYSKLIIVVGTKFVLIAYFCWWTISSWGY